MKKEKGLRVFFIILIFIVALIVTFLSVRRLVNKKSYNEILISSDIVTVTASPNHSEEAIK